MDSALCWKVHIDSLCSRLRQRLYFLRRLKLYGVSANILLVFYQAPLESFIHYVKTAWFGTLSVELKSILARIHKTAIKIIEVSDYKSITQIYHTEKTLS